MKWAALENWSTTVRMAVLPSNGETHDKIQAYMGPGTVKDRQWFEMTSQSLQSLVLCEDCAGNDKLCKIWNHSRPPKALSHEGQGPTRARVTGKPGGMGPLQDRGQRQSKTSGYPGSPLGTLDKTWADHHLYFG
jgi:hypothetical protein